MLTIEARSWAHSLNVVQVNTLFTREQQDEFAITSLNRALAAIQSGKFNDEIAPVTMQTRKGEITVSEDESPGNARIDKIPNLKPAFKEGGTITAANASSISDGAASLMLMRESTAERLGYTPRARILGHSSHSHEPEWFTTAPVGSNAEITEKVKLDARRR